MNLEKGYVKQSEVQEYLSDIFGRHIVIKKRQYMMFATNVGGFVYGNGTTFLDLVYSGINHALKKISERGIIIKSEVLTKSELEHVPNVPTEFYKEVEGDSAAVTVCTDASGVRLMVFKEMKEALKFYYKPEQDSPGYLAPKSTYTLNPV